MPEGAAALTIRILASSALVGPCLQDLGGRFPELCIAPHRSLAWKLGLNSAEALLAQPTDQVTEADLAMAPRLKVVGTCSAEVDHLPLETCAVRGITVVNTPMVPADATADLALAMLLSLTRRLADGEALARSGTWKGWALDQVFGVSLAGKTCGILGSGAVGRAFARRVAALGMQPVFWARADLAPVDYAGGTAPRLTLEDLLPIADVLSVHCPLTVETRNLLSAKNLERLPAGAYIINTARGGILNEPAAIRMLQQGLLAGVGMDVYDAEPDINEAWFSAPRALLLPHLGSATRETREAMARVLCDGVGAILEGKLG